MKKFVIVFCTLFGLLLSKSLFFTNDVVVSFNQNAQTDILYQFFYTNNVKTKFNKDTETRYQAKKQESRIRILVATDSINKIRFDFGLRPGKVKISDLRINGKKLDLHKFTASPDVESMNVSGDTLTLISNKPDPGLFYQEDLHMTNIMPNVNYPMLIILICLWSTLSYFLVSFVFSKENKIDALFIVTFGIMLFIPMLHVSDADKSDKENRMLAVKPELFVAGDINNQYGNQFNDWFNDRFFGRNLAINIDTYIKYNFSNRYCNQDYCLYNHDFIKPKSRPTVPSADELERDRQSLKKLDDFCKKNKIHCYVYALPVRELFLPDATPTPSYTAALSEYLQDKPYGFIENTSELLVANEQEPVFFKTDHHWTEWGAWVAYKHIAAKLKQNTKLKLSTDESFYDIVRDGKVRAEYDREFLYGHLCKQMNLTTLCPLTHEYKYFNLPKNTKITRKDTPEKHFAEFLNPDGRYSTAVVIGTSMAENIAMFFAQDFKRVHKYRTNNHEENNLRFARWQSDILKAKPQLLVFVVQSGYLGYLQNMWGN